MTKERISASVDAEVEAYLSRDTVNASGLINKLVKEQMASGGDSEQLLQLRLEQINTQIEQHESQLETLEKEREAIKARLDKIESKQQTQREETYDTLETVPWRADNPAIKSNADDLGMTPEELITELEEYHAE